jgi:hypothetical protein
MTERRADPSASPTAGPKHTPGPWYPPHLARDDVKCDCETIFSLNTEEPVASVIWANPRDRFAVDYPSLEEAKANARLIAAAPDLLEALEALLVAVKQVPAMNHMRYDALGIKVNAALAKARGES